jgi:1-acyl-sn-glycerol-3-phosphate acyltransferase
LAPRLRTFFVAVVLSAYLLIAGPPALLVAWSMRSARMLYALTVPAVRFGLWAAGVRIDVHGLDRLDERQNYLFMPNHISNVDPPLVVAALRRDVRMMGKASLFRLPIFGRLIRLAGFVPVIREDRDAAIESGNQAAKLLRQGLDLAIFPEGTRSRDGNLLPLKKGPFFIAQAGGVPVVPVRVRGTREVMKKGGTVIYPGSVEVEVCRPIDVAGLEGDDESVRGRLRTRVTDELRGDLTRPERRVTPQGHERA